MLSAICGDLRGHRKDEQPRIRAGGTQDRLDDKMKI